MFQHVKSFCDSLLELGLPGLDLIIYKDGECILRHMTGYSDIENKIKINGKERYNLYSCSKPITCTAALQLLEKGRYALDDKLSDYMPEFKEMTVKTQDGIRKAKNPILIHHLFEMTAGFSYDCESPQIKKAFAETNGKCPTRETIKYLAAEPLCFSPGDEWRYSLCHDVLAALVEVLSGEKFEDYVKKHVFDAVGMTHSTFMLPESELETIAQQYQFENGAPVNVGKTICAYKFGSEYASGGAGGISTAEDIIRFLEGLRTCKLLKPETLSLMTQNRLNQKQMQTYTDLTHGYGLGVRCAKPGGLYTDFGWSGAAGAYMAVDMQKGISLHLASHLRCSPSQGLHALVYRLLCAKPDDTAEFESIAKDIEAFRNYNLTY